MRVLGRTEHPFGERITPDRLFVTGMGDSMRPTDLFPVTAPTTTHPRVGKTYSDDTDEYIGRGNNGDNHFLNTGCSERGSWGNPYPKSEYGLADCLIGFGLKFADAIATDEETRSRVKRLRGLELGCYCHDLGMEESPPMDGDRDNHYCHGDLIAHWADALSHQSGRAIGVCGSRTIYDQYGSQLDGDDAVAQLVGKAVAEADNIPAATALDAVIHGDNGNSPDAWGSTFAEYHDLTNHGMYPSLDLFGKEEYFLRNSAVVAHLLTCTDAHLIAFWDGDSTGTKDTIDKARNAGIPVTVVNLSDNPHHWLDADMLGQ